MTDTDPDIPLDEATIDRLLRLREEERDTADPHVADADDDDECEHLERTAAHLEGLLQGARADEAARHLATCQICSEASQLLASPAASHHSGWRRLVPAAPIWAATVAVAAVGVVVWVHSLGPGRQGATPDLAHKGSGDELAVAAERAGMRFRATSGEELEDGDRLGLFYSARVDGFIAVFDVSLAQGAIPFFPAEGELTVKIRAGVDQPLPEGAILKRREGCEWIVAIFTDDPVALGPLLERLSRASWLAAGTCNLQPDIPQARSVRVFSMQ
jgi:hypothetical protein